MRLRLAAEAAGNSMKAPRLKPDPLAMSDAVAATEAVSDCAAGDGAEGYQALTAAADWSRYVLTAEAN